jgi:hypothetical protein
MMPQEVVQQDDKYNQGDDATNETQGEVSHCFLSSIIPQECGSGNDTTIKLR